MKLTVKQTFYQSIGIPRFSGMFVEPVINVAIMIKMREPTSADGEMNRAGAREYLVATARHYCAVCRADNAGQSVRYTRKNPCNLTETIVAFIFAVLTTL